MSLKNSNDTIGNRTRDLPACTAVPQSIAPPRARSAGAECPKSTHGSTYLIVGMHEDLQSNIQGLHPILYGTHSQTGQATQTV